MGAPFVVLDGIDGCGKSTQAARLVERLGREGIAAEHLREPGSTAVGEAIRALLLSREHRPSAAVEALLFAAARRQLLEELVTPALAAGRAVVCERFHPSTFAYQAVAGGLDEGAVAELLERWAGEPAPDLVVLLDVPLAVAAARRGDSGDRIEDKGDGYLARVAEGYRRYAERHPGVAFVDGEGDAAEVAERVWLEVRRVL